MQQTQEQIIGMAELDLFIRHNEYEKAELTKLETRINTLNLLARNGHTFFVEYDPDRREEYFYSLHFYIISQLHYAGGLRDETDMRAYIQFMRYMRPHDMADYADTNYGTILTSDADAFFAMFMRYIFQRVKDDLPQFDANVFLLTALRAVKY